MTLFSFYTNVYNAEDTLERCIESVLNQTLKDFEYIIVNNGSTDGSGDIIEKYSKIDSRVKVINFEENQKGVWPFLIQESANGKYFVMIDADDHYELEFAESMYAKVQLHNLDLCCCSTRFRFEDGSESLRQLTGDIVFNDSEIGFYYKDLYQFLRPVWGKLISMDLIKKCSFKPYKEIVQLGYGADTVFCLEILSKASRIGVFTDVLYNYTVHSKSVSYVFNPIRFESDIYLLEYNLQLLQELDSSNEDNQLFVREIFLNSVIDSVQVLVKAELSDKHKRQLLHIFFSKQQFINTLRLFLHYDRWLKLLVEVLTSIIFDPISPDKGYSNIVDLLSIYDYDISLQVYIRMIQKNVDIIDFFTRRKHAFLEGLLTMENVKSDDLIMEYLRSELLAHEIITELAGSDFVLKFEDVAISIFKGYFHETLSLMKSLLREQHDGSVEIGFLRIYREIAIICNSYDDYTDSMKCLFEYYQTQNGCHGCLEIIHEMKEMNVDNELIESLERRLNEDLR